ncbi:MAG: peptidoglycan bridge formation glycyltransferase FemA/FemB family protein [Patescibacteria group bacterium]|nr:peptidoglycan bridge formation glycyltransferase FemA/FemB family protein [Patescibacteria group bacterium]
MSKNTYKFQPPTHPPQHIVQSTAWGKFKTEMGTAAVKVGNVQITLHKIPALPFNIGYCPKVNPTQIDWKSLRKAGREHNCAVIRFDCPNVIKKYRRYKEDWNPNPRAIKSENILKNKCTKAPRNTFAQQSVLLNLTHNRKTLLMNMKSKTRYNVRYAKRKGIYTKEESNSQGLEKFLKLQKDTAKRQDFLIHNDKYYKTLWNYLAPKNKAHILIAYYKDDPTPLTALMFFNHKKVLYYPYGGSSNKHRNRQHSSRAMWAGIKLGQSLGCKLFDMWGATDNKKDEWWGFTRFKLGFGGTLVGFIDSYDLVLNPVIYHSFNLAYHSFWKAIDLKKWLTS